MVEAIRTHNAITMIIAYPLSDIVSYVGPGHDITEQAEQRRGKKKKIIVDKRKIYQLKGIPTEVTDRQDDMMFLKNKGGEIFCANINRLIWAQI